MSKGTSPGVTVRGEGYVVAPKTKKVATPPNSPGVKVTGTGYVVSEPITKAEAKQAGVTRITTPEGVNIEAGGFVVAPTKQEIRAIEAEVKKQRPDLRPGENVTVTVVATDEPIATRTIVHGSGVTAHEVKDNFDNMKASGEIPKGAKFEGYDNKTGEISYSVPPPTLDESIAKWRADGMSEVEIAIIKPLHQFSDLITYTFSDTDTRTIGASLRKTFSRERRANDPSGYWSDVGSLAYLTAVPFAWAGDTSGMSTRSIIANTAIDIAYIGSILLGGGLKGLSASKIMKTAKAAGNASVKMDRALSQLASTPVESTRYTQMASKTQKAIQTSHLADLKFTTILEKVRLTTGELSKLEKYSRIKGLKKAIIDVSKAQTDLEKAWQTADKMKKKYGVNSPQYYKALQGVGGEGYQPRTAGYQPKIDLVEVARLESVVDKAKAQLRSAQSRLKWDSPEVAKAKAAYETAKDALNDARKPPYQFGVDIGKPVKGQKVKPGVSQAQTTLNTALENFHNKLKPRYDFKPTPEFKGYAMKWRQQLFPILVEGEPKITPLSGRGKGVQLAVLEKTKPKVEIKSFHDLKLKPIFTEKAAPKTKVKAPKVKKSPKIKPTIRTITTTKEFVEYEPGYQQKVNARPDIRDLQQQVTEIVGSPLEGTKLKVSSKTSVRLTPAEVTDVNVKLSVITREAIEAAIKAMNANLTKNQVREAVETAIKMQLRAITRAKVKQAIKTKTKAITKAVTETVLKLKLTIKIPPPRVILPDGSGHTLTKAELMGAAGWKQGFIYKMTFPPYGINNIVNSRKPIPGIKYYDGARSAYKSIVKLGGKLPKTIERDMGIMDITITTPKGGQPKIAFKPDILQKTTKTRVRKRPKRKRNRPSSLATLSTMRFI